MLKELFSVTFWLNFQGFIEAENPINYNWKFFLSKDFRPDP